MNRFVRSHFLRPVVKQTVCLLVICLTFRSFGAGWPARIFAPYMYIGADDHFQITDCADRCGQKFYTLAFIIADKHGNPAWDGRFALQQNLYADQIKAIRHRGGDVIVSFGGGGGKEIALVETNVAALQAKYQSVISRYHFNWLDFDIEGGALNKARVNERRNEALAGLQRKNRRLRISFTLPVDPDGIPESGLKMMADARAHGVKIYSANVMTMDYGSHFSHGKKMSDVSIASALKAREQCAAIDPGILIGLTPMIGQNDEAGEVFGLEDARALKAWADDQPWICSLSFWASNRDAGKMGGNGTDDHTSGIPQQPWDFTRIFEPFTTAH